MPIPVRKVAISSFCGQPLRISVPPCIKISVPRFPPTGRPGANRRYLERVTQVMDWVRNHFQEQLTLDDAAASLAVSREYFCRLFKRYTGQTFLEYLNSVRTMHLYEDLKNTDDSITVLMEKNGISNYKVFMRTFKKLYGDTPQKIRSGIREYFSPELPS